MLWRGGVVGCVNGVVLPGVFVWGLVEGFCPGRVLPGGFVHWGVLSTGVFVLRVYLSREVLTWRFCPGGFCPRMNISLPILSLCVKQILDSFRLTFSHLLSYYIAN